MEPMILALMIFTVVVMAMVGGFILLLPVTRRLGDFLEYRMSERGRLQNHEEMERVLRALESLRDDVAALAARQDFTERMLEKPGSSDAPGP